MNEKEQGRQFAKRFGLNYYYFESGVFFFYKKESDGKYSNHYTTQDDIESGEFEELLKLGY